MPLETGRLTRSRRGCILQEFFTNSAHFPIANVIFELLEERSWGYLLEVDPWLLLAAAVLQATVLGAARYNDRPLPLLGNLVGPLAYTLLEVPFESSLFFGHPNHIAYWGFSLCIGLLQYARLRLPRDFGDGALLLESVVRTSIVLTLYLLLEMTEEGYASAGEFLRDPTHLFIVVTTPLLGLVIGFASVRAEGYLLELQRLAAQLRRYSEWLLGPDLLSKAVSDPSALGLTRRERTILFADVRGFTAWSEPHPPEDVVRLVNAFYAAAEPVWESWGAIKVKLTADEIMLVFADAESAAGAAYDLHRELGRVLVPEGLGVGIGIHTGPVVEGLIGADGLRAFDLIGDAVNTAKRLCDLADPGETLLSDAAKGQMGETWDMPEARDVRLRGKTDSISVWRLHGALREAR